MTTIKNIITSRERDLGGFSVRRILPNANQSPVKIHSDLFYLSTKLPKNSRIIFPKDSRETAVYLVDGRICINHQEISPCSMAVMQN